MKDSLFAILGLLEFCLRLSLVLTCILTLFPLVFFAFSYIDVSSPSPIKDISEFLYPVLWKKIN